MGALLKFVEVGLPALPFYGLDGKADLDSFFNFRLVLGNDQILCGNVASTYYLVMPMKDPTRALRTGIPYVICSTNSSLGICSNGNSLGSFDMNTADPMTSPHPTPGFALIFANPLNNQTLTQPSGTTFYWYGNVDFTHANVTGISGGGGGGGGFYQTIQSNGTAITPGQAALNFIQGSGMTVNCVNNGGAGRTDCTFAASVTGGVISFAGRANAVVEYRLWDGKISCTRRFSIKIGINRRVFCARVLSN